MRKSILALVAALLAAPAAAQRPPPPKLVVVIKVDGLSSELFAEYRPQFAGGFARLASGTTFVDATTTSSGPRLGDIMKAHWPTSRSIAVSGSRTVDPSEAGQHFAWTGTTFVTDSAVTAPPVLAKVNSAIAAALAQPRPALEVTPFCASKASANGGGFARPAGDAARFAASPELDGDTLALAGGLVETLHLGRGPAADMVSVNLSATGNVASTFGGDGQEMCLQLTELDRETGDFLLLLDSRGIDYAVALEGSGRPSVPILFWRPGFRGATVQTTVSTSDVAPTLAALVELPVAAPPAAGRCLEGTPAFCQ